MAGEQTIGNDGGGRKIGERGREIGENPRENGERRGKIGETVGKLGAAFRKMGTVAFAMGSVAGKMGMVFGKLGTAGGELGTALRNWGSQPEKCAADGSRPVLGMKFLRSGCELFARWLSRRLPTVPRMLMECGQKFVTVAGGRQTVSFENTFRRIESDGCQFSSADGALTFNLWRTSR